MNVPESPTRDRRRGPMCPYCGESGPPGTENAGDVLCLNLEDMWDDYAASAEHSIAETRKASRERRVAVLERSQAGAWTVRELLALGGEGRCPVCGADLTTCD